MAQSDPRSDGELLLATAGETEAFAAALEASVRYEPRPEPARGWLYGIAWNKSTGAAPWPRRGR